MTSCNFMRISYEHDFEPIAYFSKFATKSDTIVLSGLSETPAVKHS